MQDKSEYHLDQLREEYHTFLENCYSIEELAHELAYLENNTACIDVKKTLMGMILDKDPTGLQNDTWQDITKGNSE